MATERSQTQSSEMAGLGWDPELVASKPVTFPEGRGTSAG